MVNSRSVHPIERHKKGRKKDWKEEGRIMNYEMRLGMHNKASID
jgi:hypothetical protein